MIPYQGVFWEFSSELIIYNPISVRERFSGHQTLLQKVAPAPRSQSVGFLVTGDLVQSAFDAFMALVLQSTFQQ